MCDTILLLMYPFKPPHTHIPREARRYKEQYQYYVLILLLLLYRLAMSIGDRKHVLSVSSGIRVYVRFFKILNTTYSLFCCAGVGVAGGRYRIYKNRALRHRSKCFWDSKICEKKTLSTFVCRRLLLYMHLISTWRELCWLRVVSHADRHALIRSRELLILD